MNSTSRMTKALLGGLVLLLVFALAGHAAAQSWTQLAPTGGPPTPRDESTSVYDPTTNSMIVFGGAIGQPFGASRPTLNDVWVLSNANGLGGTPTWTQLTPTGGPPTARGQHNAVYDPTTNRMIMFGGNPAIGFCVSALSDIWVLTNANGQGGPPSWIELSPVGGSPQQRMFASAVYDSANNRMIVFGGTSTACGFPGNLATGVWVLSNANGLGGTLTWTQLSPTGSAPLDRLVHTAVYDPTNNRMIVFGGLAASGGLVNDVWVLSNANGLGGTPTWTQLTPGGAVTPIRDFHSAVYDPGTNKMIVFGGANIAATPANPCFYSNDVWVLSNANGLGGTPTWTQLAPTGGPPEQRAVHTAVFNSATNRMTIFGGGNCTPTGFSFALGDVWVLTDANGIVTVPFAAFAAKVEIELGPLANDDAFEVKAIFTLGAGSDGISPLTEDVHLQVGTFSTTIPAGSFKVDKKGRFKFEGIIGGVSLQAKITPRGANSFEFKAEGQGADLTGTANPVTLGLTIGDDSGSTTVTAEFE